MKQTTRWIEILKKVSKIQIAALTTNDSAWKLVMQGNCYKSYCRILHLDHEPTEAYIASLYKSAPDHSSRSHHIERSPDVNLITLSVFCELDTSG